MPDVPLDGMRGDAQSLGNEVDIERLSHQMQHLELSWGELRDQLLMYCRRGISTPLACDGFGEQAGRYQHLALRRAPNGLHDLVPGGRLGQVGGGACVDRIEQVRLRFVAAVEDDRRGWISGLDHARRRRAAHIGKVKVQQRNVSLLAHREWGRVATPPRDAANAYVRLPLQD